MKALGPARTLGLALCAIVNLESMSLASYSHSQDFLVLLVSLIATGASWRNTVARIWSHKWLLMMTSMTGHPRPLRLPILLSFLVPFTKALIRWWSDDWVNLRGQAWRRDGWYWLVTSITTLTSCAPDAKSSSRASIKIEDYHKRIINHLVLLLWRSDQSHNGNSCDHCHTSLQKKSLPVTWCSIRCGGFNDQED